MAKAPPAEPTHGAAAACGAYYFGREVDWLRRHVETVQIMDERLLRRRLTIDLDLPRDGGSYVEHDEVRCVYYVPVALIVKQPATSNVDLTDEDGTTLPLLTRAENRRLSGIALEAAVRAALDAEPPSDLLYAVDRLLFHHGDEAIFWHAKFISSAREDVPSLAAAPGFDRFRELSMELALNSLLWTRLEGRPGQRRVLQFSYDVTIEPPALLPAKRPGPLYTEVPDLGREEIPRSRPPVYGAESISGRIVRRLATNFGLAAVDLYLPRLHMREVDSYHLQVQAPPGLELRALELEAVLVDRTQGKPLAPLPTVSRTQGELHFSDAQIREPGPAVVSLRAGRRGFLSLSLMTVALIAAGLWALWLSHGSFEGAEAGSRREVAAAAALIVPALLAAFVVRPGEHSLTTRLLSGVRLLVLAATICSVASAVALAEVRPGFWQDLESALVGYAIGATACAVTLLLAVVTATNAYFDMSRQVRRWWRSRQPSEPLYKALVAASAGATVLAVLLIPVPGDGEPAWVVVAAAVFGLAFLAAVLSALRFQVQARPTRRLRVMLSAWWLLLAVSVVPIALVEAPIWSPFQIAVVVAGAGLAFACLGRFGTWDRDELAEAG